MGVPGLWDLLRPCGETYSLLNLAVDAGFVQNHNRFRAYRIGIDASIWFFHAQGGREGENPELRTIFFRCARLLAMPFLPLFVFDGPKRPKIKRGKVIGGKEHWMVNSLRTILDAFGYECRTAPGEAEAELAYLNSIGIIDAVLSDDVDCFIFGAPVVIRNLSSTLSAKAKSGKEDGQHVNIYKLKDIEAHPDIGLTQGGLVLIALLRGGDYDQQGIDGCGVNIAQALARAGFGDRLLSAARSNVPGQLEEMLPRWRKELREELASNASGFAPRKSPTVSKRITNDFPNLDILRCYTHPVTSESEHSGPRGLDSLWQKRADVAKIARVCELYFEWGVEAKIIKRFRSFLWPGVVLRTLLYTALDNEKEDDSSNQVLETPSKGLARQLNKVALSSNFNVNYIITAIHSQRQHKSTDGLLEYRLEIKPEEFVSRARSGIQGTRVEARDSAAAESSDEDEDEGSESESIKADPDSALRIWMPAVMVTHVCPTLVDNYVTAKAAKVKKKKATKPKGSTTDKTAKTVPPEKQVRLNDFIQPYTSSNPSSKDQSLDSPSTSCTVPPEPSRSKRSQNILERLDNDPFIASIASSRGASTGIESKIPPALPTNLGLRPFPTIAPEQDDDDDIFNPAPGLKQPISQSSTRALSPDRKSESDKSLIKVSPRKSPRKTKTQTSPHIETTATTQAPLKLLMRPLDLLKTRLDKPEYDSEIIVISSDSDSEADPERLSFNRKKPISQVPDFIDLT